MQIRLGLCLILSLNSSVCRDYVALMKRVTRQIEEIYRDQTNASASQRNSDILNENLC